MAKKHRAAILQAILDQHRAHRIARECGVSRAAVSQWDRIPVEHVIAIEKFTGIPRETLRPDIYGAPRPRPPMLTNYAA